MTRGDGTVTSRREKHSVRHAFGLVGMPPFDFKAMPENRAPRCKSVHPIISQFQIAADGGPPIYRQIVDQLRALVLGGQVPPGHAAPSVRALAAHLSVSPMTVSKAYGLLAGEGVLEHQPGLGMFVPRGRRIAAAPDDRLTLMEPSLRHMVEQAARLRLPPERVLQRISELLAIHDAARDSKNADSRNVLDNPTRETPEQQG